MEEIAEVYARALFDAAKDAGSWYDVAWSGDRSGRWRGAVDEIPRRAAPRRAACRTYDPFVVVAAAVARTTAVELARGRARATADWARLLTPFIVMLMMMI